MSRLIEPLTADERLGLIAAARSFMGAPFRHQGRTAEGMDCIGLLGLSFALIGKLLRDRTDYGRIPAHKKLQRELAEHFGPPVPGDPVPGDVVSLAWAGEPCHVAIVTPHPDRGIGLIHCYLHSQRVIEHGIDPKWRSRICGRYSV
jgi:cell wall-associated NlpC family hydrolase